MRNTFAFLALSACAAWAALFAHAAPTVTRSLAGTPVRATALLVHPDELSDAWIDRAARLGVVTLAIHPCGGAHTDRSLEDLLARCRTPAFRRLVDRAWDSGLQVEYEAHVGSWLLPRTLFATQPERFRMNDAGQRTNDFNFCVSDPETLRIVESRTRELVRGLYRSAPRHYLWLDDAPNSSCRCARCRGFGASDQQLLALNRMLAAVRCERPEARLAYLAYFDTLRPPVRVRPADGIFLEYAPIQRTWDRPVASQPQKVRAAELTALLDFFGRDDARVLEYWFDNSLFSKWTKPEKRFTPGTDVFAADVAWYAARGFGEIASFACFLGPGYERRWGVPDVSAMTSERTITLEGLNSSTGGRDATRAEIRLDADDRLRFAFTVTDATPTHIPVFTNEVEVAAVDRVEIFLSPTADLTKRYYCLEMTPEGHILDYAAESYRKMDAGWTCRSLELTCRITDGGYEVAGSLDWKEMEALGLTRANVHLGVFRADFRAGGELVSWLSACPIDATPDFHRPGSLFAF